MRDSDNVARADRLSFERPTSTPCGGGAMRRAPATGGAEVYDATRRFEIEILLKAGLPKSRVAEIAGVSLREPWVREAMP